MVKTIRQPDNKFDKYLKNTNAFLAPSKRSKIFSLISFLLITLGVYIFGYIFSLKNGAFKNSFENDERFADFELTRDYSVSRAIGSGSRIGLAISLGLAVPILCVLQYTRKGKFLFFRYISMFLIIGLLIPDAWINNVRQDLDDNPDKANDYEMGHVILSAAAFATNYVYLMISYYIFYKNNATKFNLYLFTFLALLSTTAFIFAFGMQVSGTKFDSWVVEGGSRSQRANVLYATMENINVLGFFLVVLLLGFYE